jgi:hypothetical protein
MPEASGRRWRARNETPRRRERRDAQGGGSMEAGADDNQRIMTSKSLLPKKPVIMQLSADPSESLTQAARTPKETERLSLRSAPARSTPARHSESARKRPHTIVSRRIRRFSGVSGILCGCEGFCDFCKIPRLLSDSKSGVANSLDFRGDGR